jgi:RsiW-degrading membrane proteinase PrsW (M82 family)
MTIFGHYGANLLICVLPALAFLLFLYHVDSFKLVRLSRVVLLVVAGAALAGLAWAINGYAINLFQMKLSVYSRSVAPIFEETLKASALAYLFLRNHIGFRVDAAILGFAVGTGFSIAENAYLLRVLSEANLTVWIIRGFGTAMMHGGTTAIVALTTQTMIERRASPLLFFPGLLAAIVLHAAFNYSPDQVILVTIGTFIILPIILLLIIAKSEHAVHNWLETDYETHEHLLQDIESGEFEHQEGGRFIRSLAKTATKATASDMFAYVKLHTLLVLRAEKKELTEEAGGHVDLTKLDAQAFDELHALERRIGRTALLALQPHLKFSRQELFELYKLEVEARNAPA